MWMVSLGVNVGDLFEVSTLCAPHTDPCSHLRHHCRCMPLAPFCPTSPSLPSLPAPLLISQNPPIPYAHLKLLFSLSFEHHFLTSDLLFPQPLSPILLPSPLTFCHLPSLLLLRIASVVCHCYLLNPSFSPRVLSGGGCTAILSPSFNVWRTASRHVRWQRAH